MPRQRIRQLPRRLPLRRRSNLNLADEIIDFVRDYFESPQTVLMPETDIATLFGIHDPDGFGDFLEDVGERFGIKHRELKDVTPGADMRPQGIVQLVKDLLFQKIDTEVIYVDHLTINELCEIAQAGIWPERFIKPSSQIWSR